MIPEECVVCFIVFLDNKNIWFGEKNQVSISIIEKVMIILMISKAILNFSVLKNPVKMKALHSLRYYYGVVSMHNQMRNKLLSCKTRLSPLMKDHINFYALKGLIQIDKSLI